MKKNLLLATCLAMSSASFAQTNTLPMTGNVGVGTTTPGEKLEVYDGHVKVSNNAAPATIILAGDRANSGDTGQISNRLFFQTDNDPNEGWGFDGLNYVASGKMQFSYYHAGAFTSVMTLGDGTTAGQGFVGIGTTTPKEKLSVNGNIRAQEIKVESQNWPDYVFSTSYKPATLLEIEKFIQLNNHLPEIPSADDVQKKGIAVGEMHGKLLKKIEELTLHMIDMDKKITRLENENSELKNRK
jgi:hypothetical protein